MYQAQLKRIRHKLKLAKIADKKHRVFGADSHRYRIHKTISLKKLKQFEEQYNIELPLCYAEFLLHVGNGGAGPFYGIYRLGENLDDLCTPYPHTAHLNNPCLLYPHMSNEEWQKLIAKLNSDNDETPNTADQQAEYGKIFGGLLPIGTQGCCYLTALVLNGDYRGRVVNLDLDHLKPIFSFEVNFLDWYERWLDEVINGEEPSWFGYTMGGTEEHLLDNYQHSDDETQQTDYLTGLLNKKFLKPYTLEQLENALANDSLPTAQQDLLLRILCKNNYQQAKPHLSKLAAHDLSRVCHIVCLYAEAHCADWADAILQTNHTIDNEHDFKAMLCTLHEAQADYGAWLAPYIQHTNPQIRSLAAYYFGLLPNVADYQETLLQGLQDSDEDVVLNSLQALGDIKNQALLPAYQQLLQRFPKDSYPYIYHNLKWILAQYKLTPKKLAKMTWHTEA